MIATQLEPQAAWKRYWANRSTDNRRAVATLYLPLLRKIANVRWKRMPRKANLVANDLVSFGMFGLLDAVEKFNPKWSKFGTYAGRRINGAISDGLRSLDWDPRLARHRRRKVRQMEDRLGRAVTPGDLRFELGVGEEVAATIMQEVRHNQVMSLDAEGPDGDTRASEIAARNDSPADSRNWFDSMTRNLSREERFIIILQYCEGCTQREIANAIGVSASRVSQMHDSILARLRARLSSRECLS